MSQTPVFFLAILSLMLTSCLPKKQKEDRHRPNIVLIMADDMGCETVACYGGTEYATPNLDKMAARGVRFSNCFSQPLCTPSRVKIMTGKYNFRNYEHFGYLDPGQHTFGNYFRNAGYGTCIAGKWQLSGLDKPVENPKDPNRPHHFGFEEYCLWQMNHTRDEGERYADPLLTQNGKDLPVDEEAYGPDVFTDFICDFIDRKADSPFFVYYPMVLPHGPYVPTPDSPEWADVSSRYRNDTVFFEDMITYIDKLVLKIENSLKENGVFDNTILIFTADNGTGRQIVTNTTNGSVQGGKGLSKNTGNHVPFIFTWGNRITSAKIYEDLIDFADVLPTLLDAAGIEISKMECDGTSFLGSMTGESTPIKDEVFIHYSPRHVGRFAHSRWVLDGNYKLFRDGRFYNSGTDPEEQHPLTDLTKEEEQIILRFQSVLDAKEKEAPFHLNDTLFLMNKITEDATY